MSKRLIKLKEKSTNIDFQSAEQLSCRKQFLVKVNLVTFTGLCLTPTDKMKFGYQ